MKISKEINYEKGLDKNLQDDWMPNHQRKAGATSSEVTEYGGDLKRKDTINGIMVKESIESQKDSESWKK